MNEVRLIDANALKFKNVAEVNGKLTHVLLPEEIANAPTVELNDKSLEIARKSIELGRNLGKLEGKLERTPGEWENYNNTFYKCPDCGYLVEKDCPNCGNRLITPWKNER